jgi:hypothetical protein
MEIPELLGFAPTACGTHNIAQIGLVVNSQRVEGNISFSRCQALSGGKVPGTFG